MIPGMERFRGAARGAKTLAGTIAALTAKHKPEMPALMASRTGREKARAVMLEMQNLADAADQLAKTAEACRAEFARHLPEIEA